MKIRLSFAIAICLLSFCVPACADKAPAAESLGSKQNAAHLVTHIYAYTDGWDGYGPSACEDEGCADYGHVHCYGVRVKLWDTPNKGSSRVAYYPGGFDGRVGPDTEFQLIDVVAYKGKYYANIRVLEDGHAINSGFVDANFIGCDCEQYETFEEIPEYIHDHGAFSLK